MKIISVVGARPNFMKIAPLHRAFVKSGKINSLIVHTGQHYDEKMSDIFFKQLELPKPDFYLGIGGGSHTYQKANVMLAFEKIINDEKPDLVLVVGDVNATAACSITAVKMGVKCVHVEAGLRSGDRSMPEEVNRIITDSISDGLFVTEQSGIDNLKHEGVPDEKVFFTGNVMIDNLIYLQPKSRESNTLKNIGVSKDEYVLMTMHRPHNVDNRESLLDIIQIIKDVTAYKKVVFPMHPRTKNNLEKFELFDQIKNIDGLIIEGPLGYLEFLNLMENATVIITDSGGIQEETTYLQVPCITFRDTTERPVTVNLGTNFLMKDLDPITVKQQFVDILNGKAKQGVIPPLWDGRASERIAAKLIERFEG